MWNSFSKKVLLLMLLICFGIINAQETSKFNYGIHLGVNSANLTEFESGNARIGLSAGLYAKYNFSDSGFSLRSGVNYSQQGVKDLDETIEGDVINLRYSEDRDWNVFQIPLIVQYSYKKFGIFLGPQLSFLTEDPSGSAQNPILSGVIGLEAFLTKHIFLRLQYDNSFTEAFTGLNQRYFPGGAGQGIISTDAKQYVYNFSVGYQF